MSKPYAALRTQIDAAREHLRNAAEMFRRHELNTSAGEMDQFADEMIRLAKRAGVYTQKDGWLDAYEADDKRKAKEAADAQ